MKVGNPMNLDIYNSIHRSVDGIIAYLDQESDFVQGLDKLYNGGWVSDTQLSVVRSKLGMKVDKPSASDMIVFRKEKKKTIKKKKKKKKKSQHKLELETMIIGQSQETSPSLQTVRVMFCNYVFF